MTRPATVTAYIAAQPPVARKALDRVRTAIRRALPGAEEVISYGIPAYRLHGRIAIFFAGWKTHVALYPAGSALDATFKAALARYERSKGTIKFPLAAPMPVGLIGRIARFRARALAARAAATTPVRRAGRRGTGASAGSTRARSPRTGRGASGPTKPGRRRR